MTLKKGLKLFEGIIAKKCELNENFTVFYKTKTEVVDFFFQ